MNDLYSIHSREYDGKKIGIIAINSSWRCNSTKDFGNLLVPNRVVENISLRLKDYDFKILLVHHPLEELKWWNRTVIENKIFEDFHVMLLGHIHKGIQSSIPKNDEGIITSSSTAILSGINDYEKMGFSVLDVNMELKEILFKNFNIDSQFYIYNTNNYIVSIPVSGEKQEYIDLRKKITHLYNAELENGDDLFINNGNYDKTFFEKFSSPVLKSKSTIEIKDVKNSGSNKNIEIKALIEDLDKNRVIYGKDKYGKTVILFYIYLKLLSNFSEKKVLPLFIDVESDNGKGNFTIQKYFKKIYSLTNENFNFSLKKYNLILLIDDFSKLQDSIKTEVEVFIKEYPQTILYVTDDESIFQYSNIVIDSLNFEKIFIHELTSHEVRDLTKSSLNCSDEKNTELLHKIKALFTQLNLNYNFWTISLFIYIFNKSESSEFRNNFELVELYIDNLLDKEQIISEKSMKIKYQQLKDFLSEFAYYLVKEKRDSVYHVPYDEIILFIKTYKQNHSRFVITTEELCELIIKKGIIKLNKNNDNYSFRLRGIFEYFIAMYMSNNEEFTTEVLSESERQFYLSFGNELELYAGFAQKDENFAEQVLNITKDYYIDLNDFYSDSKTDFNLITKVKEIKLIDQKSIASGIVRQIEDGSDEIMNELGDRKVMNQNVSLKDYKEVIKNGEQLEKALFILSRVYRNTEFKTQKLEDEILDFILQSACNLSFLIIDENNNSENENDTLLGIFRNFAQLVVQNFLFDAMAQESLTQIFLEKIEVLKKIEGEELKLFILYFILVDLDFNANKKYILELIKILNVNLLKYGVMYKLVNYLIFNKTSDKNFIKNTMIEQQKKIDNSKKGREDVQKWFSKIEKISLTNRIKDKQLD